LAAELTDHNALEMKIVGALGLEDKIRPKAKSALHHAVGPDADRITVRLVSGDAKETCMAIALQVGLVTEENVRAVKNLEQQNVILDA
jgi:magnesium-transporting ATPase (P-type)